MPCDFFTGAAGWTVSVSGARALNSDCLAPNPAGSSFDCIVAAIFAAAHSDEPEVNVSTVP